MLKRIWQKFWRWLFGAPTPQRKIAPRYISRFVEGDELPELVNENEVVVAREGDTLWSAAMICPCGCKQRLEVMLLDGVKPRWDFFLDAGGRPSLKPSVWRVVGCRSHFWLRGGQIIWCEDSPHN